MSYILVHTFELHRAVRNNHGHVSVRIRVFLLCVKHRDYVKVGHHVHRREARAKAGSPI